jgi:ABC-type transport system substrate-binding protein
MRPSPSHGGNTGSNPVCATNAPATSSHVHGTIATPRIVIGTRLLNRYEVVSELGRGGMGVVYRARDPLLNRDVAVKLIPPALLSTETEERFQREAQLIAQMNHPAIVSIFDIGRHEGSLFFLMPVVTGSNLRRFFAEKARSVGDVIEIGIRVAEALEYSHARGVIHRDIKPENVMVAEEQGTLRTYVMDFGLAKASSENRLTKTGTLVGTVAYFSPEQVVAHEIDHRSDIYSLGVVLYECLSGEPPFTGEVQALLYRIVHDQPRSLRSLGANISPELEEIILCCLSKDPAKRYPQASELAAALRRCQARLADSEKSAVLSAVMTAQIRRPAVAALVNREKEFAELQRRLNSAQDGQCQFVAIGGEAGIGKTRLVEELEALARSRNVRVAHGRFVEESRGFPFQAFCGLIQDYFRWRESASSSGPFSDLSDIAGELVDVFPVLNEISAIRTAAASTAHATGTRRDDKTYVYELLARTLTRIASGKPLLIILENLHAAETSLEALQYVMQRLEGTPLLIVGTYRQTEIHKGHLLGKLIDTLGDDPRFGSMVLGPLTPSQHQEFLASVVGTRELSTPLVQRIYEATEGNPFFTRELVRSLMESGGILRDTSGTWTLSGGMAISSDALPATIQQTVEKRVERLPEDVRDVLSVASVLGKSFDFEDLEALVDDSKLLDKAVDCLVAEGLIEEDRQSRGDRLAFSSGIVHDVLYGSLSRRRRRSLHLRCAEHLERRYAKRLDVIYPQLVHHFSEGDEPEKTVEYGLRQARQALEAFSAEEAIEFLQVVLEFAGDREWTGDRHAHGEARLLLAHAHRMHGTLDSALREAEAALRIFEAEKSLDKAVEAIGVAADAAWQARRIDDARRWLELGIERARLAGRNDRLINFLSLGATVANLRGEYDTAKVYFEAIEAAKGSAAEKSADEDIPIGGILRCPIANISDVDEPATVTTEEDSEIAALVFETLISTDANGRLIGSLASSWELTDDGQSLRVSLRENARFSDGSPVTAGDIKASFERAARAQVDKIPAALQPVKGIHSLRSGESSDLAGVRVVSSSQLLIELDHPLGIYPAMLTAPNMAVAKLQPKPIGSGPFRVANRSPGLILLNRNENYWKGSTSRVDAVEFRVTGNAQEMVRAFRASEIDIARDLPERELDSLLRDPRLRPQYVEAPRKNTYFILLNQHGPMTSDPSLRKALTGVLRVHDLVWRSVGRLVQPAPSLVPPAVVGHDPGRRREVITREQAGELVAEARRRLGTGALRLAASVHPIFLDRYAGLLKAIADAWKELGVDIELRTSTTESYLATFQASDEIDVLFGRWNADYDDADNFTYGLFHSDNGVFRRYFSSPASDALLEKARAESNIESRESLYRAFESSLGAAAAIVPLFYEINYRVARRALRRVHLRSSRPYLNYAELGIASDIEETTSAKVTLRAMEIHVPIIEEISSLDPADARTHLEQEVQANVFETLTRCREGARIVPWLATRWTAEDGGLRYRVQLREDVRFHDGRRLTARDVRFSWERRLQNRELAYYKGLRCIRGASELMRGEAGALQGFRIVSSHEFVLELVEPLALLPALLSGQDTAIAPEGTVRLGSTWRDGCAGTGPFRVVDFQPGRYLELDRNPDYWRTGLPKCDRLVFHLGETPERIRDEFLAGKLSIASDLLPADVDSLLHNRELAAQHKSMPRLCVYFVALNLHSPKLSDVSVRRALIHGLDIDAIVRRTLGRLATPATGVIPPGLLGHTGTRPVAYDAEGDNAALRGLELRAAVQPLFLGQYAALTKELDAAWKARGVGLTIINTSGHEYLEAVWSGTPDIVIGRWMGSIPDADYFTGDLVRREVSFLGRMVGTAEIDSLIERARSDPHANVRNALYRQIEEAIAREAVLLPLFNEQAYRFVRPEIEGLTLNLTPPEVSYEELTVR